jgi:hypothetical protein
VSFQPGTLLTIAAQGITPSATPLLIASTGFFDWLDTPAPGPTGPLTIFITGEPRTSVYAVGTDLTLDFNAKTTVIPPSVSDVIEIKIAADPVLVVVPL